MSTKVSIALTDLEEAELEGQARMTGKTKTALAGEHFRAQLSNGTSTIKAIQEIQAKLRLSNRELNAARRIILDNNVADTAGTATGPAWSPDQLDATGLRAWWQQLEDFVGQLEVAYELKVAAGWWIPGVLFKGLAVGASWWRDLELPGGAKAAKPRDEVEFLRWINEDLRVMALAHNKALADLNKLIKAGKRALGAKDRLDGVTAAGALENFVDEMVRERSDHPPEVAVVKADGSKAELKRAAEAKADRKLEKEHEAYLAGPRRPRPGTSYKEGVDPETGELDPDLDAGLDPEEAEYRRRRRRDLAAETAQDSSPGAEAEPSADLLARGLREQAASTTKRDRPGVDRAAIEAERDAAAARQLIRDRQAESGPEG